MNRSTLLLGLLPLLLATGCDPTPAPGPATTSSSPVASSAPRPATSSSAAPPPSASVAVPQGAARKFAGSTEVKKTKVSLPSGVKVAAWRSDDGKSLAGNIDVELVLAPGGAVSGSGKGALGELTFVGAWEGERVHAEVTSKDPDAEDAVRGTIEATVSGKRLAGVLRAASTDANRVREAQLTLSEAP